MNKNLVLKIYFYLYCFCVSLNAQNDLIISDAQTINGSVTYDNVTIQSGGTLTLDGSLTVNDNLLIENGGLITHSERLESGLTLNINGILNINSGGEINTNGKGLKGGGNNSAFGNKGETYDNLGNIISGTDNYFELGSGGAYGGQSAWVWFGNQIRTLENEPYGLLENPIWLGAGGSGIPGGNGGGKIHITATQIVLEGNILANGLDGSQRWWRCRR